MTFAVYLPPQANQRRVPALLFLSGLTCSHEHVMMKGQYQQACAELGIAFIASDTSPRGDQVPNDSSYDLGQGAGFYLDAKKPPWSRHFKMESYLLNELISLCERELPIDPGNLGIMGHSMGGHGALILALRHPGRFRSLSAFAPICAPSVVPWGEKAFKNYLGSNARREWARHDASQLITSGARFDGEILVDVGAADGFLNDQLRPWLLSKACRLVEQPLTLREHAGYDHTYHFVASFMADHISFHAKVLLAR